MTSEQNYTFGPLNLTADEVNFHPLNTLNEINSKFGRVLAARLMGMWEQRQLDSLPHIEGNYLWAKFQKDRRECERLLMPLEGR